MSWIQVRARLPQTQDTAPYVEVFRDFGIENTLEEGDAMVGAIVVVEGTDNRVAELSDALRAAGALQVTSEPVVEVDWDEVWRQHFHPRRIGRHFIVRPTWEDAEVGEGDIVIVLDPGQAFGTGDHPTTRLCLELLEAGDLRGKLVADVGCGSGILSIAAVKLGAIVEAVDIEEVAVAVTKENAEMNGVSFLAIPGAGIESLFSGLPAEPGHWEQDEHPLIDRVPVGESPTIRPRFDLVISNIISAVLIGISRDVAAALKPGGIWIVSGIIPSNWPEVERAALEAGFELDERREEDGWVAARLRKRGA
jgi:ribosomal protein L11 methyltransferase